LPKNSHLDDSCVFFIRTDDFTWVPRIPSPETLSLLWMGWTRIRIHPNRSCVYYTRYHNPRFCSHCRNFNHELSTRTESMWGSTWRLRVNQKAKAWVLEGKIWIPNVASLWCGLQRPFVLSCNCASQTGLGRCICSCLSNTLNQQHKGLTKVLSVPSHVVILV
jgi:hypothetical protein